MSKEVSIKEQAMVASDWTPEQIKLIADTVAKNATPDELKLFLYRCKNMRLDPLKPGQVHFVKRLDKKTGKYGPGTIMIGIDGFRSIAARTGKHVGTTRGIIRDAKGHCIGAWAEVHRSDWKFPAREEVSFAEYNTGYAQWAKMPETMIKKVAESAALRMAFPDDLGGVYSEEEMGQAESKEAHTEAPTAQAGRKELPPGEPKEDPWPVGLGFVEKPVLDGSAEVPRLADKDLGEYVIPVTQKFYAKKLKDITVDELSGLVKWYMDKMADGGTFGAKHQEFLDHATRYIETQSETQVASKDDGVPF